MWKSNLCVRKHYKFLCHIEGQTILFIFEKNLMTTVYFDIHNITLSRLITHNIIVFNLMKKIKERLLLLIIIKP